MSYRERKYSLPWGLVAWWKRVRGMNLGDEFITVSGGDQNLATGPWSTILGGKGVKTRLYGEVAHGSGFFGEVGDCQRSVFTLRVTTTDNSVKRLYLDGDDASKIMTLPADTSWTFRCLVLGKLVSGAGNPGDTWGWYGFGVIRRGATAAATVLVGSTLTSIAGDAGVAGWGGPTIGADTTYGALNINVQGQAGDTVRWAASMEVMGIG